MAIGSEPFALHITVEEVNTVQWDGKADRYCRGDQVVALSPILAMTRMLGGV